MPYTPPRPRPPPAQPGRAQSNLQAQSRTQPQSQAQSQSSQSQLQSRTHQHQHQHQHHRDASRETNPLKGPSSPFDIPMLYPPEGFSTLHPLIYRCTSIDSTSYTFLSTLNLRTILTLSVEKPRPNLVRLSQQLGITLVHSALWTMASPSTTLSSSTTTTTQPIWEEPAWRQAVDEALGYLSPRYRPVLVVDGVGVFCGVVRRGVMGWGVTGTVLEYRSFFWGGGGGGGRYGCEEVVEMVDTEGEWGGRGVDDLRVGWRGGEVGEGEGVKEVEKGGQNEGCGGEIEERGLRERERERG